MMDYLKNFGNLPETSAAGFRRFPVGFRIIHHRRTTRYVLNNKKQFRFLTLIEHNNSRQLQLNNISTNLAVGKTLWNQERISVEVQALVFIIEHFAPKCLYWDQGNHALLRQKIVYSVYNTNPHVERIGSCRGPICKLVSSLSRQYSMKPSAHLWKCKLWFA